jgi:hypothetical protein
MGNRREQRTAVSLPVRVRGIDPDGNPFSQSATVVEISGKGAKLADIRCLREAGDLVEITFNHATARFRVEWIGSPGSTQDGQAGVSSAELGKNIWRRPVAPPAPDLYEPHAIVPSSLSGAATKTEPAKRAWDGTERRRSSRVSPGGTVRLQVEGASFPIWAELADISLGGCYVKVSIPIKVGASASLSFSLQQQTLNVKGRVVSCDSGVGAGIRFELEPNEMLDLWRVLRKMGSDIIKDRLVSEKQR